MVDGVMSILSSDFAKAGVELKLQPVDAATFSANVTQGHKYDISYSSWGTIDDVDTTLLTIFGHRPDSELHGVQQPGAGGSAQCHAERNRLQQACGAAEPMADVVCGEPALLHLFVPNNTYAADTTNFTGWHLSPGNSAFLACANFVNVHAK